MSRLAFSKEDRPWLALGAYGGLALALGLPLAMVAIWSFSDGWFPPHLLPQNWTLRHWLGFANDRTLLDAFFNSVFIAITVTLLSTIIAIPTAWAMARFDFRLKRLVELFVLAPLIVPGIVIAVGLGRVFLRMELAYTLQGVILVQIAGVLPLTIRILSGAFESIPAELIYAARTLGAGRRAILRHIIVPLGVPAMLAAGLLSFVGSFEEFERTFIIGAPFVHTLPTKLYTSMQSLVMPVGSVVCFILLLPVLIVFILAGRVMRDDVMAAGMGKL